MLFDESAIDPAKTGPKAHGEPDFPFLQSSAKPEAKMVRELLEAWFAAYPAEHQDELRQRIVTSKSDIESTAFELALHAALKAAGAEVEIHPKVSDETDKRPDFLVRLASGFEFYLEAVLARGQSDEERNREAVVNQVYAVIDRKLISPEYFWAVTVHAQGPAAPSVKQIVHALATYAKQLDRDAVLVEFKEHGFDTTERLVFEDAGWNIVFIPIPKKPESFGKPDHRPLGSFHMPSAVRCNDEEDIRAAVKFKVKHHAAVDKPYVVAVNACNWSADLEDFINGLYGSDQVTVTTFADGSYQTENTRGLDGVWLGEQGPKNSNLIAVLGVRRFNAWSVSGATFTLFENPYIAFPPEARIPNLPRYEAVDGKLVNVPGATLGQLFDLSPAWPKAAEEVSE